jgi:hypothetical protein
MSDPGIVASVRQKLLNASKKLKMENEMLMRRYAFERLLGRLAASPFREDVCLKGAMAFLAITGDFGRPTRDMDFAGIASMSPENALEMWRRIATVDIGDDGLEFLPESFTVTPIQEQSDEPGNRIEGEARMGPSKIKLKIEMSYGHALTPGAIVTTYPTILDEFPIPSVLCYSAETVMAEKFEAICSLGERNSRFKDFYDIRGLARSVIFDADVAARAFKATFARRETELPLELPAVFLPAFEASGQRGWAAFLRKMGLQDKQTFAEMVDEITPLVMGVVSHARGTPIMRHWEPGAGWQEGAEETDSRTVVPF